MGGVPPIPPRHAHLCSLYIVRGWGRVGSSGKNRNPTLMVCTILPPGPLLFQPACFAFSWFCIFSFKVHLTQRQYEVITNLTIKKANNDMGVLETHTLLIRNYFLREVEFSDGSSPLFASTSRVRVWRCRVRTEYESSSLSGITPKKLFSSLILLIKI